MNAQEMDYGEIEYKDATYQLTEQATLTNRVFTGWFGDAEEGEEYQAEYKADALSENGYQYTVYWKFPVVKGDEEEDESNYPWEDENIDRVEIA